MSKIPLICLGFVFFMLVSCSNDEAFEEEYSKPLNQIDNNVINKLDKKQALRILDSLNLPIVNAGKTLEINVPGKSLAQATILYDDVTQVINQYGGQNITFKLIHPMTTSFRFYNMVISSDSTYTTAKLKEYIMTPTFHNALMANLVTLASFEGVVLSQTLYTDSPCPDEDVNLVIGNPDASSGGGTQWIEFGDINTGPSSGINWSGFFGGSYSGSSGGGSNSGGPSGNDDSNNSGSNNSSLAEVIDNIGTAVGDVLDSIWRWINSFFGGCNWCPKNTLIQTTGALLVPSDDTNSSQNSTDIGGLPCPNLGNSNFAVLGIYDLLTGDVAAASDNTKIWWETLATDADKLAITNLLLVKGYTQENFDFIDNLVTEKQAGNLDISTSIIFTLSLNNQQYDWFTNQDDTNLHDFTLVNALLKILSENTINNQTHKFYIDFIKEMIELKKNFPQSNLIQNIDSYVLALNEAVIQDKFFYINELLLTINTDNQDVPWNVNHGFINGINSLEYTHTRTIVVEGRLHSQFLLVNTDVVSTSDYTEDGAGFSNKKWFYYKKDQNVWYDMPEEFFVPYTPLSLDFIFNGFWSAAAEFVRIATPLEDILILIEGENFEGAEESRAVAGLFIALDVAGKPVKITRKAGLTLLQTTPRIIRALSGIYSTQKAIKDQYKHIIVTMPSIRKGNFGEIVVDLDFESKGYEVLHINRVISIDHPTHHGIDHIFKNPETGEFVIVESKFLGTGGLKTLVDGTRQMSDAWISDGSKLSTDRLWTALGGDLNLYNQIKTGNNYTRIVAYIQPDGKVNYKYVSSDGIELSTNFPN